MEELIYIIGINWIWLSIMPIQLYLFKIKTNNITKHIIKILTCFKCLTLWSTLTYLIITDGNILLAPIASLIAALIDKNINI